MKPATAAIVREIRQFQKETGMSASRMSSAAGLSPQTILNWLSGHCGSSPRSRRAVRKYMREYSQPTLPSQPREAAWDDAFVRDFQSANAFKVETPVHPGVFQRIVAPVRRLFSRGEAA